MKYYTASQSRKIPALQKPPGHGFCFFIASCSRSISAFTVSTQDWNSAMGIFRKYSIDELLYLAMRRADTLMLSARQITLTKNSALSGRQQ